MNVSGCDAYHRYFKEVSSGFVQKVGGRLLLAGPVDMVFISEGCWDEIIIGHSPSKAHAMRFFGHFEGDPQLFRAKDEVKELRKNADPIKKFIAQVTGSGQITMDELTAIDAEILALLDEKVAAAKAAPEPPPEALYTDVYINY